MFCFPGLTGRLGMYPDYAEESTNTAVRRRLSLDTEIKQGNVLKVYLHFQHLSDAFILQRLTEVLP